MSARTQNIGDKNQRVKSLDHREPYLISHTYINFKTTKLFNFLSYTSYKGVKTTN